MRSPIDRRTFARGLIGVAALAFARPLRADAALDGALVDVAAARASLTTLQGPFVQERTIALLASKVKSTGHMYLVRPDRLRWELDPPDAATYWVLPDALAYQTKSGTGRISKGAGGPLGGVLSDLLVLLGGDLALLKARYDLTLLRRDATGLALAAVPRDKALAKTTKRIELTLGSDLVALQRALIVETGDDRSDIAFGALVRGGAVDPKLVAGP